MATKATSASTAQAAGVKTPVSGAYSDPAQVGAMIKQMYPQYANFDPVTIGQRWIDMHAATAGGAGSGAGTDVLSGPTGTTATTSTDVSQQAPDLSGLAQFASPVPQSKPQPAPVSLSAGLNALNNNMGGVNGMGQASTPYTTQPQTQQQPKSKPLASSTFDISKVRF